MSPLDKIALSVSADDGGEVEITVQDGAFRTVARADGYLNQDLPAGIYTVIGQAGNQSHRQMVVLEPGKGSLQVRIPPVVFSSPVPLKDTSQTHEYHQIAAHTHSRRIHATVGNGSAIFIAVREYSGDPPSPRYTANPMEGLTLLDASGSPLVDLAAEGVAEWGQPGGDPWGCCNIVLNAGFYRLRQVLPSGDAIDLGLVASPGWQTQVFALIGTYGGQDVDLLPDLLESSILMTRFDAQRPEDYRGGYSEFDEQYQRGNRMTEIARLGLANRRAVLKREMYEMLYEKFDNPMLGILGSYLLLAHNELNYDLRKTVVGNLRGLLGEHPDVEALALGMPGNTSRYTFPYPPMLRRSWALVVKASWENPALVPTGSLSYNVAACLWGEEPWNVWRARAASPEPAGSYLNLIDPVRPSGELLSPYEKAVLHQVGSTGNVSAVLDADTRMLDEVNIAALRETKPEQLAESLGLPRANVETLLTNLTQKASFYEFTHSTMLPGKKRTQALEKTVSDFKVIGLRHPKEAAALLPQLIDARTPGGNIAALALLQVNPNPDYLPFILTTIQDSKSVFEQYHGLIAARALLPDCTDDQKTALRSAIITERDKIFTRLKPGTDRRQVADYILSKLSGPVR